MRFSVQIPTDRVDGPDEFLTAEAVSEMARGIEAAGFDACYVTEHPFPGDRWLAAGGHHALDPFVALSFAAAATTRLRLQTNILVLAYRNPFLAAKSVASLDVLSGGRMILGVAAGYLRSEFEALGADLEQRNEALDQGLVAMRRAFTESGVVHEAPGYQARGNTMLPRPIQQPGPPIWVGGNSRRAIRRAAAHADGWIPFPTRPGGSGHVRTARMENLDDLRERTAYLRAQEQEAGRGPLDICFMPFGLDMFGSGTVEADAFIEAATPLAELGVTWTPVWISGRTRAEYLDRVARFGDEVIRKAKDL